MSSRNIIIAAAVTVTIIIAGGLCFYIGSNLSDSDGNSECDGPEMREPRIGDTVTMVCSFPAASNHKSLVTMNLAAYENGQFVVMVEVDGASPTKYLMTAEDFLLKYPESSMYLHGEGKILTAFGELECEIYLIDYQDRFVKVWYHNGIGFRMETSIDGTDIVIDRIGMSFVTI